VCSPDLLSASTERRKPENVPCRAGGAHSLERRRPRRRPREQQRRRGRRRLGWKGPKAALQAIKHAEKLFAKGASDARQIKRNVNRERALQLHGKTVSAAPPFARPEIPPRAAGRPFDRILRAFKYCRNLTNGRQFNTRSLGTPPLRAITTPQCVRSIVGGMSAAA
jgi:hypothetical protein